MTFVAKSPIVSSFFESGTIQNGISSTVQTVSAFIFTETQSEKRFEYRRKISRTHSTKFCRLFRTHKFAPQHLQRRQQPLIVVIGICRNAPVLRQHANKKTYHKVVACAFTCSGVFPAILNTPEMHRPSSLSTSEEYIG